MSEPLTREEIRRACLAVDWPFQESGDCFPGSAYAIELCDDGNHWTRFHSGRPEWWPADALALLEATGLEWFVERYRKNEEGEAHIDVTLYCPRRQRGFCASSEDLPTAAVRAVLQATQAPGEELGSE